MKGEQALGSVTHTLMRVHYPYRPGHSGRHICPAKSMVETPIITLLKKLVNIWLKFG